MTTPIFDRIILRSFGSTIVADQVFDLRHIVVGHFEARSGGNLHVDGELPGVGLRKEGPAEKRIDGEARHEHAQQQRTASEPGRFRHRRTAALIEIQQAVEPPVEPCIEPAAPGAILPCSACFLSVRGRRASPSEIASRTAESRSSRRRKKPAAPDRTPEPAPKTGTC